MPINKIVSPSEAPTSIDDWVAMKDIQEALLLAVQGAARVVGSNIVKGAIFLVGGSVYMAGADTAISGTASDYVKLTIAVDGLTLTPSFVDDLTGVSWSSTWNGYYDVSGNLYEFDELKALAGAAIAAASLRAIGGKNLAAGWAAALIVALGTGWGAAIAQVRTYFAGANYLYRANLNESKTSNSTTYITSGVLWRMFRSGTVTVSFRLYRNTTGTAYARIYKNGVAVGTERSATSATVFDENIAVNQGDILEIFFKTSDAGGTTNIDLFHVLVGNTNL